MHHRVYRRGSVSKRQEHARLPGCSSQSSSKRVTIAHGDALDRNCMVRNGWSVLIDFELIVPGDMVAR
jgi:aminoglycoside phosphotransferase (APT) family kinase protein